MASPPALEDEPKPTSVRFATATLKALDELAARSKVPRSSLIQLGVDSLLAYEARTGKLLVPKPKRPTNGH